jgi:hypothetical protein
VATIRRARDGDAAALAGLAERTFRDAFTEGADPADMAFYCAASSRKVRSASAASAAASPSRARRIVATAAGSGGRAQTGARRTRPVPRPVAGETGRAASAAALIDQRRTTA